MKTKKFLSLLLVIAMIFTLAVPAFAEKEATEGVTVYYTNDVHTYIANTVKVDGVEQAAINYAKLATLKANTENCLLVDAGDHIQGTAYGGMDKGATIVKLMEAAGYDLATMGNHEFDYGMERALQVAKEGKIPYVSCNFYNEKDGVAGDPVLEPYKVFEVNGIKIAFVGVTTPESFTKSTPKYFQDEEGNYIYGIAGGTDGAALYAAVQKAVDAAKAEADVVVGLGHLGDDPASKPWTSEEVIANTVGFDAFIDGHSHSSVPTNVVKDKEDNDVVLTQTGNYLNAVGKMVITEDGISTELIDIKDLEENAEVKAIQDAWVAEVDGLLDQKIAESDINFTINFESGKRAVRATETNLGDLNADAYYWYAMNLNLDPDMAIMNGGGIRAAVPAGDWTYKTCKTVNTFGNVLCVVEITGQQIKDALEFGARFTTGDPENISENGGFLQVAGCTYKVDASIKNTVKVDEKTVWTEGPEVYRVYDIKIYDKDAKAYVDLDLEKTYRVAGTNYTLYDCGDGFAMFKGGVHVLDGLAEDYMGMASYLAAFADTDEDGLPNVSSAASPLAALEGYALDYENAFGVGRIAIEKAEGAVVYYTNDVHSYINQLDKSGNKLINYAKLATLKASTENSLLVDAGDHIQGTAYGGMDKGATIVKLMEAAGYDLATMGNHEFDYGMERALQVAKEGKIPYVSCNFYNEKDGVAGDPVLDAYKVFEVNGIKIAFVGVTTPESFTKSTPKYFQDEEGNYIYGIAGGTDGAALYAAVQKAVDAAKAEADVVVGLGHLGDDPASKPWTSEEVIANTVGFDAFIDGHSHSSVPMKVVKDKEDNDVVLSQTGNYLNAVGKMVITEEGITTELIDIKDLKENAEVKAIEDAWISSVDEQLGEKIAESDIDFAITYDNGKRAVRSVETNLGDLNADAYYWYAMNAGLEPDMAIMNGGGIRAAVPAGEWTYNTCKTVNTFGNVLCVVEITGQQIKDALEFGARFTMGDFGGRYVERGGENENGGFLQVAGCTYKVDATVKNTVKVDEKTVWTEGPEAYRVYDIKIYDKDAKAYVDLDLEKTYRVAGTNYTLYDCGDGFAMFKGGVHVLDGLAEDYMGMASYLAAFADTDEDGLPNVSSAASPLAALEGYALNYENKFGAGRIDIKMPAFTDTLYNEFFAFIEEAAAEELVLGYGDGTFGPDDDVSRVQFVTLLWRLAGSPEIDGAKVEFADKADIDECYMKAVEWGVANKIIFGYGEDNTFRPNENISRAQMAAMMYRYLTLETVFGPADPAAVASYGFTDEAQFEDWSVDPINAIANLGIMLGVDDQVKLFAPETTATRGMAATVLVRLANMLAAHEIIIIVS